MAWRFGRARYEIEVVNPEARCRGVAAVELDGHAVDPRRIPLADAEGTHRVRVVLGDPKPPSPSGSEAESAGQASVPASALRSG